MKKQVMIIVVLCIVTIVLVAVICTNNNDKKEYSDSNGNQESTNLVDDETQDKDVVEDEIDMWVESDEEEQYSNTPETNGTKNESQNGNQDEIQENESSVEEKPEWIGGDF